MKTLKAHYIFLTFALIVTAIVGMTFVFLYRGVESSVEKTVAARDAVEAVAMNKDRESKFMEIYKSTSSKWSRLPGYFVSSDNIVVFIEALESIGDSSDTKVSIGSINTDNPKKAKSSALGTVKAQVTAEGSWGNVMRALALSEVLPYKVSISNVRLDQRKAAAASDQKEAVPVKSEAVWILIFDIQAAMLAATTTNSVN